MQQKNYYERYNETDPFLKYHTIPTYDNLYYEDPTIYNLLIALYDYKAVYKLKKQKNIKVFDEIKTLEIIITNNKIQACDKKSNLLTVIIKHLEKY